MKSPGAAVVAGSLKLFTDQFPVAAGSSREAREAHQTRVIYMQVQCGAREPAGPLLSHSCNKQTVKTTRQSKNVLTAITT